MTDARAPFGRRLAGLFSFTGPSSHARHRCTTLPYWRTRMHTTKRGPTLHSCDGTKLNIEVPAQTPNEMAALLKLEEVLKQRQIIATVDGAVLIIPFENIKYIQGFPAPSKLPRYAILSASTPD